MPKQKIVFVCSDCGYESGKWMGKCPGCGEWNTLTEAVRDLLPSRRSGAAPSASLSAAMSPLSSQIHRLSDLDTLSEPRRETGIGEFDRVLGGGIVRGSLILLGGSPGIGKSTLLLQICQYLSDMRILYVSGEESGRQIKLRAVRLGVSADNLMILTETDCESVLEAIRSSAPEICIIDSIQTMSIRDLSSSPGSVVQVRECANALMRVAKGMEITTFLVGHINKDGAIAGPKVLEHIVDAVLYFEGEKNLSYRILRAEKNRYGSTNEIGVFEMRDKGLAEVENPSLMLLSGRPVNVAGSVAACVMEGSRPILAEVQGLAATSSFNNPLRMSTGFDNRRVLLLLAVLEKRAGYFFSRLDAYVNVVGGLKLEDRAADLPVALSLISSLNDIHIPEGLVAFGEIGLVGELRAVSHCEARIREAARLGLTVCVLPHQNLKSIDDPGQYDIELIGARNIREAADYLAGKAQ